jgi:hypothetical protein
MATPADLLKRAQTAPVGWVTEPLVLTDEEQTNLAMLTDMRDWAEHPRPDWHFYEPTIIKSALGIGLKLAETYANHVVHRFEPEGEEELGALFASLYEAVREL